MCIQYGFSLTLFQYAVMPVFWTFIFNNHHIGGCAIKIVPLFSLYFGQSVMLHILVLLLKLC